jgi:hypothetical protein
MSATVTSLLVGAVLLAAATAKLADRPGTVVALATYGIAGRAAHAGWAFLVSAEAALGAAVLIGVPGAGWAACGLLAAFSLVQAAALAAGRGGAPCGCMGSRGQLRPLTAARTAVLAGLAALAGSAGPWWLAVVAGAVAVAAGLWTRPPAGALDVAGEGPQPGERLEGLIGGTGLRLAVFTSEGCMLCRRLKPALTGFGDAVEVYVLDEERDAGAWLAARVPGAPFAVVLDGDDRVLAKGTVNTPAQLRALLGGQVLQRHTPDSGGMAVQDLTPMARRGFLGRVATAGVALAAADTVGKLVRPGQAEAYHFCGHIYTTDSCPHPTGLPRIDARGFPLRAKDGRPVDDLGRLIDSSGIPVGEDSKPLVDADGRPLPPATRTRVCTAVARRFKIKTRVDGAWYRCCNGHVRKLVDCCATSSRRINGDGSLTGYCYGGRRVFCVMYFQTKVPC